MIDYCRRFGVALQPYIFASRANLAHSSTLGNGRTVPVREALYSLQGHVAELLDKCHAKGALDLPVSGDDVAKLQEMLVQFGDLTSVPGKGYSYQNQSGRAGLERPAGVATPAKPISPMKLEEILRSRLWDDWIFRDADIYWQTSLLEPVGGMDQFFKGFLRQPLARQSGTIEGLIRYAAKVTDIDVAADKVTVRTDEPGGARTLQADYCVCTIPMPVFARLKTNLPAAYMAAAANTPATAAGKVGWQAERFWETEAQIYGGISWTTDTIDQIWYPSSDYLSAKGTLTGAYMRGDARDHVQPEAGGRAARDRARAGRAAASRLRQICRARRRDRLGEHGIRARRLGQRGRSELRREQRDPGAAAGPLPHGGRPAHVRVGLAGRRRDRGAPCGERHRPAGAWHAVRH